MDSKSLKIVAKANLNIISETKLKINENILTGV